MAMVGHGAGRGQASGSHTYGDVFPGLVAFVGAGMILAALAALASAALSASGLQGLRIQVYLIGALGAILGLFIGLGRGVWLAGAPLPARGPAPNPSPQLWDPWLDNGREEEWTAPETQVEEPAIAVTQISELPIERARVRPRVVSSDTGEAVLLEDEIGSLIQQGKCGYVQIVGGPGSGKSTSLEHLAAILPPWTQERVRLLDENDFAAADADHFLVVSTARQVSQSNRLAAYGLAPWGQDDLIEYLLAAHRDRCASVMARLRHSGNLGYLRGIPELWTVVLDLMARNESIADVRSALRHVLEARLNDHRSREKAEELCLTAIQQISKAGQPIAMTGLSGDELAYEPFDIGLFRLIRHRPVMLLMAADRLAYLAERGCTHDALTHQLPRELIDEVASRLRCNSQELQYCSVQHLSDWIDQSRHSALHPMVASLLHAVLPEWRPNILTHPRLAGAYLDGVKWSDVNLMGINLQLADLGAADLCGANLEQADARHANFCHAHLHGAHLTGLRAECADFGWADLRWATAKRARFGQAKLANAVLSEADLFKADIRDADIDRADFSGANLEEACLKGLDLKLARFERARFGGADLRSCNLEEMRLIAPDFHDADLHNALLTGSHMPKANFLGADLRNAGVADVDWPGANLRDADLRGASFHLGSSRNGLVGSPVACEGSRTGFYTDDYHDQNVKPPEEIRKANLRGADLRGANITGVDFYLVDLRDAKYTASQAEHLHCCRAILRNPAE